MTYTIIGEEVEPCIWKGNQQNIDKNVDEIAQFSCPMEAKVEIRKPAFMMVILACSFIGENGEFLEFAGIESETGNKVTVSIEMTLDEAKELNLV